jgi:hypothetical protein
MMVFWRSKFLIRWVVLMMTTFVITGCQSSQESAPPTAKEPITEENYCRKAGELLGNPYLDDWRKAALFEMMRNRGCMK